MSFGNVYVVLHVNPSSPDLSKFCMEHSTLEDEQARIRDAGTSPR